MNADKKKLGVALVGLGEYSGGQLGPALKQTSNCYLAGVVSGDAAKRERWAREYNLKKENLYDYKDFDTIRSNKDIDIVYVVLPNTLHADFAIRAAQAGKHVIVEKPLATSAEDCRRIIDACEQASVRLSVGYRLHFDPFNKEMMRLGQNKVFGEVQRVVADDSMDVGEKNQWRLNHALAGGGPLMNNGIYCVQAAIYITGELPVSVKATFDPVTDPDKFDSVEEGISWEMDFASGKKALCKSSYSRNGNLLRAEAGNGWFELEPAYEYSGLKGRTSKGPMNFGTENQQANQMDDFALCIRNDKASIVPGEMGMRDVQILEAIYKSARTGKKAELDLHVFENLAEA